MVRLKTFDPELSLSSVEEKFMQWQAQNSKLEVVSVQIMAAGGAFGSPMQRLCVWYRKRPVKPIFVKKKQEESGAV